MSSLYDLLFDHPFLVGLLIWIIGVLVMWAFISGANRNKS